MATLKTFRRDAASQLQLLDVLTTTALATGPDAAISVIVDSFAGAQANTLYEGAYVYPASGAQLGRERPVRPNGLTPSTSTLKVSWAWPAALASGVEVEILRLVPATRQPGGRNGWREIINDVLADIPTIRRYPITATAGTVAYAVPVWLEAEDQAIGIYDPQVTGENPNLSQNLRSIRYDGETVSLELWSPYSAGNVFYLAVYQPASTRVRSGGSWADSTTGLVNDDDEALAHRRLVQAMAIQRAAEQELERPDPRSKAMWERALDRWTPIAAGLKRRLVPARPSHLAVSPPVQSQWPKELF